MILPARRRPPTRCGSQVAAVLAAPEIQAAATAGRLAAADEAPAARTTVPARRHVRAYARRGDRPASSCTLLDSRAGTEERQYVTEVILRFGEGRLPNVPDNTSLRVLLSTVLNCSPMRITKKFSGRDALPRGRYRRTAAPEPAAVWKSNFGRPTPSTQFP